MAENENSYRNVTIRCPERIYKRVEALARNAGTDTTGYINAVIFYDHIYKNPHNVEILNHVFPSVDPNPGHDGPSKREA